jgi:transposase
LAGNTNDAQTLEDSVRAIDRVAAPGPIEFIADRAFPSAKNVRFLENQPREIFFIAPLATDRAGKAFRELVDNAWEKQSWEQINYANAQEIKYKRKNTYMCFETKWTLTETEKPPLEKGHARRPKGSIIYHETTVRCIVYRKSRMQIP